MAKTKSKQKKDKGRKELVPLRISVDELKVGDLIVTKVGGRRHQDIEREMKLFVESKGPFPDEGRIVVSSMEVKKFSLCEGQWRTHVHINDVNCYDTRQTVQIAVPKEVDEEVDYSEADYNEAELKVLNFYNNGEEVA